MPISRVASEEPDEVGMVGQPITFWHRGTLHQARVSKTAIGTRRLLEAHQGCVFQLVGDFGRAWIADPCTQALQESLYEARRSDDEAARRERAARRKVKAELAEEAAQAQRMRAQS